MRVEWLSLFLLSMDVLWLIEIPSQRYWTNYRGRPIYLNPGESWDLRQLAPHFIKMAADLYLVSHIVMGVGVKLEKSVSSQ
jgi:hypothetical protein